MSSGTLSRACFVKDPQTTSYGYTGWTFPLDAGYGIPFLSETDDPGVMLSRDNTLQARGMQPTGDIVGHDPQGTLETEADYNEVGELLACAMGFENPNDPGVTYNGSPELANTKYNHLFEIDDNLHTQSWLAGDERYPSGAGGGTWNVNHKKVRRGLFGVRKASSVDHLMYSTMIQSLTFKITGADDPLMISYQVVGHSHAEVNAQSDSWTVLSSGRALFHSTTVSIGSVDGTTVPLQELGVTDLEINLNNNLTVDIRDTESGLHRSEPCRGAGQFAEVTGSFTLPRYSALAQTLFAQYTAGTPMVLKVANNNGGANGYNLNAYLVNLKFDSGQQGIPDAGVLQPTFTFTAYKRDAADNPFGPNGTDEFFNIEEIKNGSMLVLLSNDISGNMLTRH